MKRILLLSILLMTFYPGFSQQEGQVHNVRFDRLNAVEFNIGGHGIYYSLGYERILLNRSRYKLSGKLNFSYYPYSLNIAQSVWIPFTFNQIVSFGKHHAEFGTGLLVSKDNLFKNEGINYLGKKWEKYGIFSVGYRHQSNTKRIFYKLLFTPVIEYGCGQGEIYPLAAGTIGYQF